MKKAVVVLFAITCLVAGDWEDHPQAQGRTGDIPLKLSLIKLGAKYYVQVEPPSSLRLEVHAGDKWLHTFPGRGRDRFDISPFIARAPNQRLQVHVYSKDGQRYGGRLDFSKEPVILETMQAEESPAPVKDLIDRSEPDSEKAGDSSLETATVEINHSYDFAVVRLESSGRRVAAGIRVEKSGATPAETTFDGPLNFEVSRLSPAPESWSVNRTVRIDGGRATVDLGELRVPAAGAGCDLPYRVRIDSSNDYLEPDEANNSLDARLIYRDRYAQIDSTPSHGHSMSSYQDSDFTLSVTVSNCGLADIRGHLEVRQIGIWRDRSGELDYAHDVSHSTAPRTVRSGESSEYNFHSPDFIQIPTKGSGRIEVSFHGDFADWAVHNPIVVFTRR